MLYAKSNPEESLKDHTEKLIFNYNLLKQLYGYRISENKNINKDEFWKLLYIAVQYHDLGKVFTPFQNVIREKINKPKIDTNLENNIPHNYLSPAFISFKDLGIDKELKKVLIQSIGYHHERDKEVILEDIERAINEDLKKNIELLKKDMGIEIKNNIKANYVKYLLKKYRITSNDTNYMMYVLIKGLLHRIDHSASAHELIERNRNENVGIYTEKFFKRNNFSLREVQKFAKENIEKNIIIIASTGMGKTESALFWIDNDKGFFTLPLRVSINALFDRITKKSINDLNEDGIGFEYTGLLHSTSMDYLDEAGYENWEEIYENSKMLSSKLTFTTIDQIFKFPFKYRGYEKMYATMAYSKIVIDEIQAYSPEIAAVILKGLEMIYKIGGKFMIMTATLPKIYTEYLEERGIIGKEDVVKAEFLNEVIRHKIRVKESTIISDIDEIIKKGRDKKVIVIVNTVDRAIELYNKIYRKNEFKDIFLLHSMFIQKDRNILERKIKEFADNNQSKGIWITTQIVEASLDVDFDYLFTELSTLDSLFQRLGRCYRNRSFDLNHPNIYVHTEEVKGIGTIYDEEIWRKSKEQILKYNMKEISERDKVDMVEKLYSKESLINTKFLRKFEDAVKILDTLEEYSLTSSKAQKMLRDIKNINAIPREVFDSIEELIDNYKNEKDNINRRELRRKINKYTVSVPIYKLNNKDIVSNSNVLGLEDVFILECKYNFDKVTYTGTGVLLGQSLSNII